MSQNQFKILPYHYIHVLNKNTNICKLHVGPQTYIREENEKVLNDGQKKMVILKAGQYCLINDPVIMKDGQPVLDKNGQVKLQLGDEQYRFYENYSEPFPLYPYEQLVQVPTSMMIMQKTQAARVQAIQDFEQDGVKRNAGDIWHIKGPGYFRPNTNYKLLRMDETKYFKEGSILVMEAIHDFVDQNGVKRKIGEHYTIRNPKQYMPSVNERLERVNQPIILDECTILNLSAEQNFTDVYGIERKAGENWQICNKMSSSHTLDLYEQLLSETEPILLNSQQYVTIVNPYDSQTKTNKIGTEELKRGPCKFILQPQEMLKDDKVFAINILSDDEALLLQANTDVEVTIDNNKVKKQAGDKWMHYGPCQYIPPVEVDIIENRKKMVLDKNEGIYVRNNKTGKVRTVIGESYMLLAHEELYEYQLGTDLTTLLKNDLEYDKNGKRIPYRVISYKIPQNSAIQVYDYKSKQSRIVFGPNLVQLEPEETFTVTSLSGETPKRLGKLKTIHINLGPEFSTDMVVVETSDHAALELTLSYNWRFNIDKTNIEQTKKIFNVKDFVGDLCNKMASKVRSAVASVDFDTFHKTSAKLIRKSVFGQSESGKINESLVFENNNLEITNIDIQNVEPIDSQTKINLQKTVTMAIEITTKRQEALARHLAEKKEQEAKGELQQQIIDDESKNEAFKRKLLELKAKSKQVQDQGKAVAEAKARAMAEEIEGQSTLLIADLKSQNNAIINKNKLEAQIQKQNVQLEHDQRMINLAIEKEQKLSEIESEKFKQMVKSIGQDTLVAMAQAGPEFQAELLKGLGLNGFIMTDGNNPINLLDSASGLIGQVNN